MRANAANLTPNDTMGTWRHELLHQFGLEDEYSNERYPISPQGGENNIMRDDDQNESVIQPYQVDRIIGKLECANL